MLQRLKKFSELSWREQTLFTEALFLQLSIGLLLKIIPFRWIPNLFANKVQSLKSKVQIPGKQEKIEQVKAAIQRSGRYSPWKNKCLVSSLAARCMLTRRKISSELSLGVAKNKNGKMIAHAWLIADDSEIVSAGRNFRELYHF